jgi:hypothetical protein
MDLCTLAATELGELIPVAAMGIGGVIAVTWIIMATIDSTVKAREKEATRRELAAYVAEGSMSAQDAANIMNAGRSARAVASADFNCGQKKAG